MPKQDATKLGVTGGRRALGRNQPEGQDEHVCTRHECGLRAPGRTGRARAELVPPIAGWQPGVEFAQRLHRWAGRQRGARQG